MDLVGIEPGDHWSTIARLAQRADDGPWESVWVYDHFHTFPEPSREATHEAWTLMAALAAVTSRVRLGQMCTCISFRNPAYLAKVAATADVVSGGRVEVGVGAGWYEDEWRSYGYGFPSGGERLRALAEGVQVLQQAWSSGAATLRGQVWQIDGAIVRPVPLQPGGIPLWIAGGGERVTLRIAAQYAAYTNFEGSLEIFRRKSAVLAEHCRAIARDFAEITRSATYNMTIGETEKDVADRLAWYRDKIVKLAGEAAAARAMADFDGSAGVGTPEQVAEKLTRLNAAGMTYAITYFPELAYDTTGVELFEKQVVPALL